VPVLKRAKEKLDKLQHRTRDAYDKLIIEALRQSFSSNITDLTKKANELKEQSPSTDLPAGKLFLDSKWDTIIEQAKSRFRYDPALILNRDTIELEEILSRAKKRARDVATRRLAQRPRTT
jgi:hypothetical protein